MAERFDSDAFFSALNAVRAQRSMTWKEVASQSKINASTLTRIGQGKKPDVNGLAALLAWSGLRAEMFIPDAEPQSPEPLAEISAIIRRDRSLSRNSARIMEDLISSTYRTLRNK